MSNTREGSFHVEFDGDKAAFDCQSEFVFGQQHSGWCDCKLVLIDFNFADQTSFEHGMVAGEQCFLDLYWSIILFSIAIKFVLIYVYYSRFVQFRFVLDSYCFMYLIEALFEHLKICKIQHNISHSLNFHLYLHGLRFKRMSSRATYSMLENQPHTQSSMEISIQFCSFLAFFFSL
ncbi:Hypothetical_protein [Hexamita inflata]|uniref:Hypothetical_protein n=1 Tax=Hexamita inflata TaxID=28002 RepID=A0AA86PBS2_9EUKA|nr:Hypothetical protein HINF_LOCUS23525 [Hexamita inflata]